MTQAFAQAPALFPFYPTGMQFCVGLWTVFPPERQSLTCFFRHRWRGASFHLPPNRSRTKQGLSAERVLDQCLLFTGRISRIRSLESLLDAENALAVRGATMSSVDLLSLHTHIVNTSVRIIHKPSSSSFRCRQNISTDLQARVLRQASSSAENLDGTHADMKRRSQRHTKRNVLA